MLKDKRESDGLGSPPDPYYINDVESKNRVLKHQNSYKPHQLPEFVKSMKILYENQKQEIDKAIVGIGEYKLSSLYLSYRVHGLRRVRSSDIAYWIVLGRLNYHKQIVMLVRLHKALMTTLSQARDSMTQVHLLAIL